MSEHWAEWQIERLYQDLQTLEGERFFKFVQIEAPPAVVRGTWVGGRGQTYTIELELPDGYPDEPPSAYILHPFPLRGASKEIHRFGTSHRMHTFHSDRPSATKICIIRDEFWSPAYSIPEMIKKARIWLTAYEYHLDTGRPIDDFLLTYPST